MKIIALSGKKQSGKSTAMIALCAELSHYEVVSFADRLKKIVCDCFGAELSEMHLDEDKNTMLPCGKTIRETLQLVGTDWFRSIDSDCWVRAYKNRVQYSARTVITPDVRFPNEVKCIQDLGGHVIRFLRAPFADTDKHESETALDSMEVATQKPGLIEWYIDSTFDAIIDNRDMTIEEQNEAVWKLVIDKQWI